MVKTELLDLLRIASKPGFRFCRSRDCAVVYFHPDGIRLTKDDVPMRIGLKEREDPRPICYCFGFTEAMAREEIESSGNSFMVERITAGIKEKRCACEARNPQGSCCLGNVRAVIRRLLKSAHPKVSVPAQLVEPRPR